MAALGHQHDHMCNELQPRNGGLTCDAGLEAGRHTPDLETG